MTGVAEPFETIRVAGRTVACDGGDGPLGHPRIFLNMGEADQVMCPYCSRLYVLDVPAGAAEPSA